jgi:hypothetical protein
MEGCPQDGVAESCIVILGWVRVTKFGYKVELAQISNYQFCSFGTSTNTS